MGLLDSLKFSTGDPEKDAQLNRGLLQMGLQLMQSRGRLFPALGQAGMVGLQAADQTRQMQQQQRESEQMRQMRQLQIGQAQREAQIAALPGQFYRAPSQPVTDATGGMETAVEAPNNASGPGGFDLAGYYNALRGLSPMLAEQFKKAITPEAPKPIALGRDQRLVSPSGQEVVPAMPSGPDDKATDDMREFLFAVNRGEIPNGMTFTEWLRANKKAGAPGGTTVTYGSGVHEVDLPGPNGTVVRGLVQLGNKPGAPPQIVSLPGTNTPLSPSKGGEKPTEDQSKAAGWLVQASNAFANMRAAISSSPGAAAPGVADAVAAVPGMGAVGNAMRSADRQKFVQGAESLSEALLRAATGAGVNKDEAIQKVRELTPVWGEDPSVTKQKMDAIPLYIETLKVRAGPAAKAVAGIVRSPADAASAAGWSIKPKP